MNIRTASIDMPFTKKEYEDSDKRKQLELVMGLVEQIAKVAQVEALTEADLLKRFDEMGPQQAFLGCEHLLQALMTVVHYEKQLETMRQSMEDLCIEMERVKEEASKTFIMGPGTEEKDG